MRYGNLKSAMNLFVVMRWIKRVERLISGSYEKYVHLYRFTRYIELKQISINKKRQFPIRKLPFFILFSTLKGA